MIDRPRLIGGLRIAVSAVFGILCVLLIVLWVRSYGLWDALNAPLTNSLQLDLLSSQGSLVCRPNVGNHSQSFWNHYSVSVEELPGETLRTMSVQFPFRFVFSADTVMIPDWFVLTILGSIAVAPWIRWTFSLRTLLIATTLIAVVLGLVVLSMQ